MHPNLSLQLNTSAFLGPDGKESYTLTSTITTRHLLSIG